MRPSLISVAVLTALAALLTACGSDDSGDGGGSSGEFGTGLQLGTEVVSSAPVGASVEPWYVWNADECAFEETDEHPASTRPTCGRSRATPLQLGYMHYGNSRPVRRRELRERPASAEKAGIELNVYNLKFPSPTEPATQANASVRQGRRRRDPGQDRPDDPAGVLRRS